MQIHNLFKNLKIVKQKLKETTDVSKIYFLKNKEIRLYQEIKMLQGDKVIVLGNLQANYE